MQNKKNKKKIVLTNRLPIAPPACGGCVRMRAGGGRVRGGCGSVCIHLTDTNLVHT